MKDLFGNKIRVLKNAHSGGYQGYVGVPSSHILYEKQYAETIPAYDLEENITVEELLESRGVISTFLATQNSNPEGFISVNMQFAVHGGITYSGCAYWKTKEYTPKNFTAELKKYTKVMRLIDRCGNDLVSYYYDLGVKVHEFRYAEEGEEWKIQEKINSDSLFARAWRVHQVYKSLKNYPKPKLDDLLDWQWGYNVRENIFYATKDDYWYFGWDCAHYRDEPSEFTPERANQENELLSQQLFAYDNKQTRYFMTEVPE